MSLNLRHPVDRDEFRRGLQALLGGPWPEPPPLDARTIDFHDRGDHVAELVSYAVEPGERVRAWLLMPKTGGEALVGRPAIAVWHQHNDEFALGKSESAGFAGNPAQHTGVLLVREGYVVLCPDAAGFEDRRLEKLADRAGERHLFSKQLWAGRSLAWKNILDCRRAVDYLAFRPEADSDRLGCYGHSLGSTFSWLVGPWEPRLKCLVGNCCMPSIAAMEGTEINHSFSNTIPGLSTIGDIPDVVSLVAPRRLHLNFGAADPLNPVEFVEAELPRIAGVYESLGAGESFSAWIDRDAGHELSDGMKSRMLAVFRETL